MDGAKNIASSSGCAMRRHIRLLRSLGNLLRATVTVYSQDVVRTMGIQSSVYNSMFEPEIRI